MPSYGIIDCAPVNKCLIFVNELLNFSLKAPVFVFSPMKSRTLRLLLIIGIASLTGVLIIQIYWFKQAFRAEEDQFHRDVSSSLFQVARQLFELSDAPVPATNLVKQLSNNYYAVMINGEIDANLLSFLLVNEFERSRVQADFEYGIYDCNTEKMVFGDYVRKNAAASTKRSGNLPVWGDQSYYFGVYFPSKTSVITRRLAIWIFSSGVLVLIVLFFAYALYLLFKQRRLSEIQRDFVNNMTHEFKTPISTISVAAQVLKDQQIIEQPQRLRTYAHIIDTENQRLKNQVDQVLTASTLEDHTLKKEPLDMHNIIQNSLAGARANLKQQQGKVITKLKAGNTKVLGDPLHLTNVVYNLLDNAIKYCRVQPVIELVTDNCKEHFTLSIKDNGIGIPQDKRDKIFDRFYRVPTGNIHDVKGFGLGLNYVQTVLKAHRGTISLTPNQEGGSIFTIKLKNA